MNQDDTVKAKAEWIDVVFDGPPSHRSGRFVEVERDGFSINTGEWAQRPDGLWRLRIQTSPSLQEREAMAGVEAAARALLAGDENYSETLTCEGALTEAIAKLDEVRKNGHCCGETA